MFTAERGKEMKKYAFIAIALLLLPLTLFASGATEEKSEYVFATDATWPPFEYIDEAGNLTGFEVELVPMIGEAVGKTFVVQNIPWDTIFAGLRNGQYDGVASGVTITEERKATIDFSTPINNQGQVLIIPAEKSAEIQSIDDLPEGAKVGVQIGTTGDFALESYPVEIRRYDDIGLAIEDMLNGNLDGAVCDSLIASDFVLKNENYSSLLTVAGEPFTSEEIAIGVQKGNTELLNLINEGLQILMDNGEFDALKAKWGII